MEEKYIQMLIETNQSAKSAHKRIDTIEKAIGETRELTIAVKEIAMETKATREDVNEMNNRLKIVEEKPIKNWENLTKTIITRNCNSSSRIFFSKIRNVKGGKSMVVTMEMVIAVVTGLFTYIFGLISKKFNIVESKYIPVQNAVIGIVAGIVCYVLKLNDADITTSIMFCLVGSMASGGTYDLAKTSIKE